LDMGEAEFVGGASPNGRGLGFAEPARAKLELGAEIDARLTLERVPRIPGRFGGRQRPSCRQFAPQRQHSDAVTARILELRKQRPFRRRLAEVGTRGAVIRFAPQPWP